MKGRKVVSVIFLALFVALLVHLVWCLVVHRGIGKNTGATETWTIEELNAKISNLEEENANLRAENECLEAENTALKENEALNAMLTDGECHRLCPVHCPECLHENVSFEEGEWQWEIVKTAEICRKGTRIVRTICDDCGTLISEETQYCVDVEHNYDGGDICPDCGYKKPEETKPSTSTTTPTTPSTTPTTPSTSECKHEKTEQKYTEWSWKAVGTADVCRKATRTVKTVCTSCNKVISECTETKTDYDHDFEGGNTCKDCGYTKPSDPQPETCKHSHTKKEYGEWSWTVIGSESCCRQGTRNVYHVCTECGVTVRVETETQTDSHSFDGRTCTKCGYKKPLEEGYGEAPGEVPPPSNEWEDEDDGEIPNPVEPEP